MVGNMGYGLWVFTNRTRRRRISLVSAASAARSEVGGKVVRSVDAEKHMKNLVWHRKTPIWSRIARKRCEDGEVRWKEKRHVHFTTCRLPFDHSGWSRHVFGTVLGVARLPFISGLFWDDQHIGSHGQQESLHVGPPCERKRVQLVKRSGWKNYGLW